MAKTTVFKAVKEMKNTDIEGEASVLFELSLAGGYAIDEIVW